MKTLTDKLNWIWSNKWFNFACNCDDSYQKGDSCPYKRDKECPRL